MAAAFSQFISKQKGHNRGMQKYHNSRVFSSLALEGRGKTAGFGTSFLLLWQDIWYQLQRALAKKERAVIFIPQYNTN